MPAITRARRARRRHLSLYGSNKYLPLHPLGVRPCQVIKTKVDLEVHKDTFRSWLKTREARLLNVGRVKDEMVRAGNRGWSSRSRDFIDFVSRKLEDVAEDLKIGQEMQGEDITAYCAEAGKLQDSISDFLGMAWSCACIFFGADMRHEDHGDDEWEDRVERLIQLAARK